MYAVERLGSLITSVSGPFHPFGGAVDIIIVQQPDGSFKSSPWYVRFGKFQGVLKTKEKVVSISVNGVKAGFHMYLDHKGEAYFLKNPENEKDEFSISSTSSGDETDEKTKNGKLRKIHSLGFDGSHKEHGAQVDTRNDKNLTRTTSKRGRIFGLMFGRRPKEDDKGINLQKVSSIERAEIAADLLEVKWSTNLPTKDRWVDNFTEKNCGDAVDNEKCSPRAHSSEDDLRQVEIRNSNGEGVGKNFENNEEVPEVYVSEDGGASDENKEGVVQLIFKESFIDAQSSVVLDSSVESIGSYSDGFSHDPVTYVETQETTEEITAGSRCSIACEEFVNGADQVSEVISHEVTIVTDTASGDSAVESEEIEPTSLIYHETSQSMTMRYDVSTDSPSYCTSEDALDSSVPLSENLEEDQFSFSDADSFVAKETNGGQLTDGISVEREDHSTENSEQLSNVSRTQTSPINIPRNKTNLKEIELLTRSLPNIRSHIHDLEKFSSLHSLSCSVETNSEEYNMDVLKKEYISSSKLEAASVSDQAQDQSTPGVATDAGYQNKEENSTIPISPDVEVSLCKHLLYEGMGTDAASEAFSSMKVNVEQISALGPSLVKNDKLVVRIQGHYFPWDAAAPIILGMASFGKDHVFEHQGMIAVDRTEKNLKADTMNGSWRLWPFSFKRSKSISAVQSTPESTILMDSKGTGSCRNLSGGKIMRKPKVMKERSLTPSSEEIASLNLKEGQNVVTFGFSTAMLGQQQVDARIYLWKWNTRIVVSDVDGTITKSDVLGQFMPLVGVDWSQTGVAHLFSAIKENGYQLLFLSARAISQAYLTRQFLFNLKQEGIALPDGPVVISPDGLFPSLYREVIRRAPHEFKIQCLEDIKAVFPSDCNPFYAGFGNRDTDEISYLKVGVPKGKIFIINPKGEVAVNRHVDTRSYTSLHSLVNGMFPAMSSGEREDYNSWNFWRLPLPDINT
ncbi:phosphatidate phosphatase PAH2 [Dioscorea cayenensis subsp. rotundata]|uniref:phosphatidate phosphatase n=1 Tax=Dioscorea cayennensis subsp. rotundata TaxID=55577 RepID=A0AB40AFS4_DIOCR|nr:phosphatidate phosphatase PAH2 [Dioscorea cayenensis subsp. rotundata]